MSENLNYFDMCSSFKCLNKMYTSCKSEPSLIDSNICTSVGDSEKTSLNFNVLPHISNNTSKIVFPSLSCASYGVPTSPTVQSSKKILEYFPAYLKRNKGIDNAENIIPAYDIIGDNINLMKSPSNMSTKKQKGSLHWCLNVAVQRLLFSSLPDDRSISDIMSVPNHPFIPSVPDCDALERNMIFHILWVATKYVDCLKPYVCRLP